MMNKFISETTLDTEAAIVGPAFLYAAGSDDLVFVKVEVKLTAHTTIPAGGSDLLFVRG
jgi:hypothetical protein